MFEWAVNASARWLYEAQLDISQVNFTQSGYTCRDDMLHRHVRVDLEFSSFENCAGMPLRPLSNSSKCRALYHTGHVFVNRYAARPRCKVVPKQYLVQTYNSRDVPHEYTFQSPGHRIGRRHDSLERYTANRAISKPNLLRGLG